MAKKSSSTTGVATAKPAAAPKAAKAAPAPAAIPAAKPSVGTTKPKAASMPTHEQIAKRAYEIWVEKGRPNGLDHQNWKQAEAELLAKAGK